MTEVRINTMLERLKRSSFRAKFKLGEQDFAYIEKKGIDMIRNHAINFIVSRIAPAFPKNDGRQTPMKGHPVFIAQHATATCCRNCIQTWHGIKRGNHLTDKEIDFITELVMCWIGNQVITHSAPTGDPR